MSNTQLSFGHVGHGLAKDFDPSPSGPVLIMAPTVFPKLAIIGTDEFATPAIWSPRGGGTISVVREFQADGIRVVLNTATAPGTASFGQVFSYLETATETGGFADGTNSFVVAIGTPEGEREVLGLWVANNEGAKFWLSIMNNLKNRGLEDILIAVVDGLKGFPDAFNAAYPDTLYRAPCAPFPELLRLEGSQSRGQKPAPDISGR